MSTVTPSLEQQVEEDVRQAQTLFRWRRIAEMKDAYASLYDKHFREVRQALTLLADWQINDLYLRELFRDECTLRVLCYMARFPISMDDLKTLSNIKTLTVSRMSVDQITTIGRLLASNFDENRFPWISTGRKPTASEVHTACVATATLLSTRTGETDRRTSASKQQEKEVSDFLKEKEFKEMPRHPVDLYTEAPLSGQFMGESMLAGHRADFIVGTRSGTILAIECKVSNSAVNSHKRLIHEAGNKALHWTGSFGLEVVRPIAIIDGVFAPKAVIKIIREKRMDVVWQHRLSDLEKFL